jgi:hypothetical protein
MPPVKSKKLARTKAKNSKTVKFNLGIKAMLRALSAGEDQAREAVAVGERKVASAKKTGVKNIVQANRKNLYGAKTAVRGFREAVKALEACDCLDQFMNCDPEYM